MLDDICIGVLLALPLFIFPLDDPYRQPPNPQATYPPTHLSNNPSIHPSMYLLCSRVHVTSWRAYNASLMWQLDAEASWKFRLQILYAMAKGFKWAQARGRIDVARAGQENDNFHGAFFLFLILNSVCPFLQIEGVKLQMNGIESEIKQERKFSLMRKKDWLAFPWLTSDVWWWVKWHKLLHWSAYFIPQD